VRLVQQGPHQALTHLMAALLERRGELPRTLASPSQWGHWIAARIWIDEGLEIRDQGGVTVARLLSAPTTATYTFGGGQGVGLLMEGGMDRGTGYASSASDTGDATTPQRPRLSGQEDAALFLIQMRQDGRELLREALIIVHAQ